MRALSYTMTDSVSNDCPCHLIEQNAHANSKESPKSRNDAVKAEYRKRLKEHT